MTASRDSYTWHFRSPFVDAFDRRRWWENTPKKQIHPIAALYELARRHPRVGALRSQFRHRTWHGVELTRSPEAWKLPKNVIDAAFEDLGSGPKSLHCLCLIGLKSWVQLDPREQEYWAMSGGRLKGLDCRDEVEQCSSITGQALADLFINRMRSLKAPAGATQFAVPATPPGALQGEPRPLRPKAYDKAAKMAADSILKTPFTPEEMEEALVTNVRNAHRGGNFVFAVAPNLPLERAAEILSKLYRRQQESDYVKYAKPRTRWTDCLPALSAFEDGETSGGS